MVFQMVPPKDFLKISGSRSVGLKVSVPSDLPVDVVTFCVVTVDPYLL